MTVPAQVLAAVRSIPHPRQEPGMIAIDKTTASDAEFRARIAGFEGAAAPESFDPIAALRRVEALAAELDERGDIEHAEWRQRGDALSLGRRDAYETSAELVRAALAPLAGQHTTDEEGPR